MKPLLNIVQQNFVILSIIKMLLILICCFVLNYIINNIVRFLYKKFRNTKYLIDDVLIITVRKPIIFLMWSYAVLCCFNLIQKKINYNLYNILYKIKFVVLVYCISLFVVNFINRYLEKIVYKKKIERQKIDYGLIEFLRKIILIISLTIITIIGLEYIGVSVKGLMALGGIGGIAVGFASKDLLSNLFGGLSIFLDKPFTVGDWISSPDKNIEGIVESIGWRETKIMSFSNYPIYLPNFIFSGIIIENKGRMKSRLINEIFPIKFVDYSKIKKITSDIMNMLEKNPFIDDSSIKVVNLNKIGTNTLEIMLYAFSNVVSFENFSKIKEEILINILEIFDKNDAKLEKRIFTNDK